MTSSTTSKSCSWQTGSHVALPRTQHLVKLKLQIPQPNRGNPTVGPPGKFVYDSVKSAHGAVASGHCGVSRMDPSLGPLSPDLIPSRRLYGQLVVRCMAGSHCKGQQRNCTLASRNTKSLEPRWHLRAMALNYRAPMVSRDSCADCRAVTTKSRRERRSCWIRFSR